MPKLKKEEKRAYPRIDAKIKVVFRSMGEFVEEYTKNISRGGIFLKTDRLLDPNAHIELMLSFPGSKRDHKLLGRVTRLVVMSDPDSSPDEGRQIYGVGIHFIDPGDQTLKAIDDLYEKYRGKSAGK